MEGVIEKEVNFTFIFIFYDNFKVRFLDIFKVEFIFSWTKKNVKKNSSSITILMLKSFSGHGKGKGGKGNKKKQF